jgi:hypothetical protein
MIQPAIVYDANIHSVESVFLEHLFTNFVEDAFYYLVSVP